MALAEKMQRGDRRRGDDLLRKADKALERALERLEQARDISAIMGHEGLASRHYFEAFGSLLRVDVPFRGRSRRPPKDPPNALLSLGYTLLGSELSSLLEIVGLEPRLGFLHGFRYGRMSLGLDLLEELRPVVVDRWVLGIFNRKQLNTGDFEARNGGVFLTGEAFKRVLRWYGEHMGELEQRGSWRRRALERIDAAKDAIMAGVPMRPFGEGPRLEGSEPQVDYSVSPGSLSPL